MHPFVSVPGRNDSHLPHSCRPYNQYCRCRRPWCRCRVLRSGCRCTGWLARRTRCLSTRCSTGSGPASTGRYRCTARDRQLEQTRARETKSVRQTAYWGMSGDGFSLRRLSQFGLGNSFCYCYCPATVVCLQCDGHNALWWLTAFSTLQSLWEHLEVTRSCPVITSISWPNVTFLYVST